MPMHRTASDRCVAPNVASHAFKITHVAWRRYQDIDQRMILCPVSHDLSFEALCKPRVWNSYFPLFRGEEFFQYRLRFNRSSMTRGRQSARTILRALRDNGE